MRFFLILTILFHNMAYANQCLNLCNKLSKIEKKQSKISKLLKKNKKLYKKYKDDISKKIKISSNILILNTKEESYKIKYGEISKEYKRQGCYECRKTKEN